MQQYTVYLYLQTALHVLGDISTHHQEHVEQFADINKLYIVAFCWIIINTYYVMHGPLNIRLEQ